MLRDQNLVPLSRQHQHALALCVRINRASLSSPREIAAWQSEIQEHFEQEIQYHFNAEENGLFPAAHRIPELRSLVERLLAEHSELRSYFARAKQRVLDRNTLRQFADLLSGHIRKEEGNLFEEMQKNMTPEQLQNIGRNVAETLASAPQACIVPAEKTLIDPNT